MESSTLETILLVLLLSICVVVCCLAPIIYFQVIQRICSWCRSQADSETKEVQLDEIKIVSSDEIKVASTN